MQERRGHRKSEPHLEDSAWEKWAFLNIQAREVCLEKDLCKFS
jgi:hypothetical protein